MPTYQADAVVLRRLDYGEADRILTLLTREHGKLAAIAKGSRRAKARSGNSLDLFARSRMMLAKGRNLDVVAQVERRGDVRHISVDRFKMGGDAMWFPYTAKSYEWFSKGLRALYTSGGIFKRIGQLL